MTGSLQRKNNKYYAVLNLYDDEGKRVPKWIASHIKIKTGSTKQDSENRRFAEHFLHGKINEFEDTVWSDMLFADFLYRWLVLKRKAVNPIGEESLDDYKGYIEKHLDPYFRKRKIKVCDMNAEIIEKYYAYESNRGISANSILHYRIPIKGALDIAVRKKYLKMNPTMFADAPSKEKPKFDYFSLKEINSLLKRIRDAEYLYPLIYITAYYGLRRSEVLGLKWNAIDFENNMLSIEHVVRQGRKIRGKDKTKTCESRRSFPLPAEIKEMLLDLKERENSSRKLLGRRYIENEYVFKWGDGRQIRPDYITAKWKKIMKRYSPGHQITFHQLRHSCASNLLRLGFTLSEVSEWLGHSSIRTTKDIYGHLEYWHKISMSEALSRHVSIGNENAPALDHIIAKDQRHIGNKKVINLTDYLNCRK